MYTSEEQHKMAITEGVGQAQTDAQSFTAPRRPHYPRLAARLAEFARSLRQTRLLELAQSRCLLQQVPAVRASSQSLPSLTTQALAMDHLVLGWKLLLPRITRKTDRGLPKYHDDDKSDVFIFSGTEDLVPVLIQNAAKQWVREVQEPRTVNQVVYNLERYRPRIEGLSLYDVAPTILEAMGIRIPEGMGRTAIPTARAINAEAVYTEEEEEELARRLEDLGYL